jgi:tRNA(Arg) A34 adenosine deaminase TadA
MRSLNSVDLCGGSRRWFLRGVSFAAASAVLGRGERARAEETAGSAGASDADRERMRALARWTALTFDTPNPVPYGAEIVNTMSGKRLMRAANAVGPGHDPSAHGEIHAIRLACAKLKSASLKGYALYTTCEPCAMCMACCLWAGLDRVVYGATIADASRFGNQIQIPAAEVARRGDMTCVVDGPVEEEACLALFTDKRMEKQFEKWKAGR